LIGLTCTNFTVADNRSCGLHCGSFSHAPRELPTRYTTADIVLEIDKASATVKYSWQCCHYFILHKAQHLSLNIDVKKTFFTFFLIFVTFLPFLTFVLFFQRF